MNESKLENKSMINLLDKINKYHKELMDKPGDTFTQEDRLMMRILTDLKKVVDKHTTVDESATE